METEQVYHLSDNISDFFDLIGANRDRDNIILFLNSLINFNNIQNIIDTDYALTPEILEDKYTDILNKELEESQKLDIIKDITRSYGENYIEKIGLKFNSNLYLYQIIDILDALTTLYLLDPSYTSPLIDLLENSEESDLEIAINLLDEYLDGTLLIDIISVSKNFLSSINTIFKERCRFSSSSVGDDLKTILSTLVSRDSLFLLTDSYNRIINGGLDEKDSNKLIPILYDILEGSFDRQDLIVYEIYLILLLSGNSKNDIYNEFLESIDLSLVSYLEDNSMLIENIKKSFESLCKKVLGVL